MTTERSIVVKQVPDPIKREADWWLENSEDHTGEDVGD